MICDVIHNTRASLNLDLRCCLSNERVGNSTIASRGLVEDFGVRFVMPMPAWATLPEDLEFRWL
jgi:hypothetical protein